MSGFDFAPMGDQLDHREARTVGQRLNVEIGRLRAENDAIRNMVADAIVAHHDDQAEIDRLRAAVVAFSRLSGCESDCEFDGSEVVHRPCCFRWEP